MSLIEKILKNSTLKTCLLTDSVIYENPEYITTPVPVINIVLSGKYDGGLIDGITTIAGPSKHFKSILALIMAKSYLDKYKDAIIIYYDNERGMTPDYFKSVGIDPNRVVYIKIHNIEELKQDISRQFHENINSSDKVFFMIDSIGQLASNKEVEDAKDQKIVVDMTRAKAFKSLYRVITPYITDLQIPFIQIAHVYMTLEMYAKAVVGGGTGPMLASDTVLIIGRAQEKEKSGKKKLLGYNFKLKIEKSRYAVEGSILDLEVTFSGGVRKYGGLLPLAEEMGYVIKPKNGRWSRPCVEDDKLHMKKDTYSSDFWTPILNNTNFIKDINKKYSLSNDGLMEDETTLTNTEEENNE